jgi:TIR domain
MPAVFLSYRRSDTAAEASRLAEAFERQLGDAWVFRDVGDIPYGAEWDAVLDRELAAARVVLVLIGPTWLPELHQRMSQPEIDYAHREVAQALAFRRRRVIPVLVRGATIPQATDLPADLATLPKRQAFTLHDASWDRDLEELISAIGRPYRWKLAAIRAIVALFLSVVAVKVLVPALAPTRVSDFAFLRVLVLSLAAAYGLVEGALAYRYAKRQKTEGT